MSSPRPVRRAVFFGGTVCYPAFMTEAKKHLVAVHGAGMHGGVWGAIAPQLSASCYFRALSLPGHDPLLPGEPLATVGAMAAWVKGKLDDAGSSRIVLMGHSMGAAVALEAADHPLVDAVILMGAAPLMPVNKALLQQAQEDPAGAAGMIVKWGVAQAEAATTDFLTAIMEKPLTGALAADLQACQDWTSGETVAGRLTKPTLVIAGEKDKLTPAKEGQRLAGLIAGSSFALLPCGHMMMVERPAETVNEIRNFLKH